MSHSAILSAPHVKAAAGCFVVLYLASWSGWSHAHEMQATVSMGAAWCRDRVRAAHNSKSALDRVIVQVLWVSEWVGVWSKLDLYGDYSEIGE
jgi:hypothetical protein